MSVLTSSSMILPNTLADVTLKKFLNGNIATQAMVLQITSEPLIPVSNKQRDGAGYPN